jgi:hypothetical protein
MRTKTSQACSPFDATGPRICAHVAPVFTPGLLADTLSAAASSEGPMQKVVAASATLLIPYLSRTTSKIDG